MVPSRACDSITLQDIIWYLYTVSWYLYQKTTQTSSHANADGPGNASRQLGWQMGSAAFLPQQPQAFGTHSGSATSLFTMSDDAAAAAPAAAVPAGAAPHTRGQDQMPSLTRSKGRAEAAAERIDQRDSQGGRCHSNSHSCGRDEPWACQQMHVNKRRPCDCMRACQYLSCQVRRRSRLMKKAQGLTTGDLAWLIARRAAEWGYSIHASEKDAVELQQVSSSFSSKAEGELCIRRSVEVKIDPCSRLKKPLIGSSKWFLESQGAGWVTGFFWFVFCLFSRCILRQSQFHVPKSLWVFSRKVA